MNAPAIPRDLFIVACLFLIWGCDGLVNTVTTWIHHHYDLQGHDLSAVGILISFGLLFSWSGWRVIALVFVAIGACLGALALMHLAVAPFHSIATPPTRDFKIFGQNLHLSSTMWFVYCIALFSLLIWEWCVLMRPEVTLRFRSDRSPVPIS